MGGDIKYTELDSLCPGCINCKCRAEKDIQRPTSSSLVYNEKKIYRCSRGEFRNKTYIPAVKNCSMFRGSI